MNKTNNDFEGQIIEEFKSLNNSLGLISKQFTSLGNQLAGIASAIRSTSQQSPFEGIRKIASGFDTKEHKEETLLSLQIEALEKELEAKDLELEAKNKNTFPRYDSKISALIVNNNVIQLTADTNEARTCSVIFSNHQNMKRSWSWDELIEAWSEDLSNYSPKTIYMAGKRINQKVASNTDIKDFFIIKTKTIQLNPLLLN